MGKIYDNVIQLIGNTPILHLHKMEEEEGLEANIYAKVEGFNPGGSVKDRAALNMIEAAEKEGKLKPGGRIVEGTSGNTGIGIALVSAVKNYHATICMQEGTSAEKIKILKAYGAEVELTPKNEGFGRAGGRAKEMEEEEGAFRPAQGENPHHPEAHILHTGPEIWRDLDGKVDLFVATVGTGGTSGGIGRFLKSRNPEIEIYGVEPKGCPVLNGGQPGPHKIQGIGAGFVPKALNTEVYDEVFPVENEDAFTVGKLIAKHEGILVGISSGAALYAAIQLAKRPENKGKTIVALLPDSGDRYYSTPLFV